MKTPSCRIDRSSLPEPHQHHDRTLSLAGPWYFERASRGRLRRHEKPLSFSQNLVHVSCPSGALRLRHHETPLSLPGVVSGKASHDPHAVGTSERATPLAPRQVGVELVAQRALSVSPLNGRTYSGPRHPSHPYGSASSSPKCSSPRSLSVAVDLGVSAPGTANV